MPDRIVINAKDGTRMRVPLTLRQANERAVIASDDAQRALDEALREQQRQVDLDALETATAGDIGRIIARLLRA